MTQNPKTDTCERGSAKLADARIHLRGRSAAGEDRFLGHELLPSGSHLQSPNCPGAFAVFLHFDQASLQGRAVTASGGLGSGTYTYDGNGLRVKKVAGSTTTVYIFSGAKVIGGWHRLLETAFLGCPMLSL